MNPLPFDKIEVIQDRVLKPVLDRLVKDFDPVEISLFGSRFRGDIHEDSDWDLLVLLDDDSPDEGFDPYVLWQLRLDCGIPVHIVSETVSGYRGALKVVGSLAREIENERRVLYQRSS